MRGSREAIGVTARTEPKKKRDLRLDFFRGLAMFIILVAHTPGNTWTLWIPARFGFSDATEIFVFCSGMASALAFGTVFVRKGWHLGAARIVYRVWQVYWAHIGVILATAALMVLLDRTGMGEEGKTYANWPSIVRLFSRTDETLVGYMTLTFVPGLFDILPMYLVILAMVPFVMLAHRHGGRYAVFALVIAIWLAAQLAGWAREVDGEETHLLGRWLAGLGGRFDLLLLPASPWSDNRWFFNPFGWQIVFFAGFIFGMRWLPAPPVNRPLILAAAAVVVLTIPVAWFKIHRGFYLPDDWLLYDWISATREFLTPLWWKSHVGGLRFLHFIALAYLAWAAVGAGGARLEEGWRPPRPARGLTLWALGAVALATAPYAYVDEIKQFWPWLDAQIFALFEPLGLLLPEERIGIPQLIHLFAVIPLIWAALGDRLRLWLARDAFLAAVPVIRKVGTQSLAVFMVSIVLSRFNGWWLDVIGRDVWTRAMVNLTGFAILIAVAYGVGWLRAQPWRSAPDRAAPKEQPEAAARRASV